MNVLSEQNKTIADLARRLSVAETAVKTQPAFPSVPPAQHRGDRPNDLAGSYNPLLRQNEVLASISSDAAIPEEAKSMISDMFGKIDIDIQNQVYRIGQSKSFPATLDVETEKLQMLVDKRAAMIHHLIQIVDKYEQTRRGILDAVRR
jgi:hypothetical protein